MKLLRERHRVRDIRPRMDAWGHPTDLNKSARLLTDTLGPTSWGYSPERGHFGDTTFWKENHL